MKKGTATPSMCSSNPLRREAKIQGRRSLTKFLETITRQRDAVWAWFEMTWVAHLKRCGRCSVP